MNPISTQSLSTVAKAFLAVVLLFLVGYFGVWQGMICRIEVPAGSTRN